MKNITNSKYLTIEILKTNDLKISLTPEGKIEIEEQLENKQLDKNDPNICFEANINFDDLFEEIMCNSDFYYFPNMGEAGFGLTSAPGFTDGYYYDDDGDFTDKGHTDSQIYWFPDYMITDFIQELYETGNVIFIGA